MDKKSRRSVLLLTLIIIAAAIVSVSLYLDQLVPVEQVPDNANDSSLSDWTIEDSAMNGIPLQENKDIYELDSNIYDVYISVFPTKDADGNMIDFSAFDLHQSLDHTYNPELNCNIQILNEGETIDPLISIDQKNAVIRVRGNSTRGDLYKSYKVKLDDEATPFFGQMILNINKHSTDPTKLATKLQTDLLTQIDNMVSYRTHFMRVWIRDASLPADEQEFEYYGLYTQHEQPNITYLEARSLSSNASIYKAMDFSFRLADELKNVDDPDYSLEEFETVLSIREGGEDHTKLLEMIEAVNDYSRDFEEVFNTYFNEENYLTWLAFTVLMGNDDTVNHNYMLYNPDNSQTWYLMPWDFDGGLDDSSMPVSLRGAQKLNQSILHNRYLRMDGSIEKIQAKMQELLDTVITEENVNSLINSYQPVIEKTFTLHPDIILLDESPDEAQLRIDGLYDYIVGSYDIFNESIQYPSPMYVAIPEKKDNNSVLFAWEPSYSYEGRTITYNVRVYNDYMRENMVFEITDLTTSTYELEGGLEPGTYYLMVTAVDSEGYEQLNLERYVKALSETSSYVVHGMLEFTIQ